MNSNSTAIIPSSQDPGSARQSPPRPPKCWTCNRLGHPERDCQERATKERAERNAEQDRAGNESEERKREQQAGKRRVVGLEGRGQTIPRPKNAASEDGRNKRVWWNLACDWVNL